MKKKILITAGVLLLLLGVLVVLPNLVDWNKFKPQFADGVRAATGQDVTIEGELTFKLLPSPAVTAANVSLANVEGGVSENFIELERLDLRVELLPLLSGDLKITSLVLEGGKIFLERDARGNANWETLFAGEGEPDEAQRQVTLESFILRGTDIYYSDLSTGAREEILGINADLVITSLSGPFEGEGQLNYRGIPVEFEFLTGKFSEGATVPVAVAVIPAEDGPGLTFDGNFVEEGGIMALSGNLKIAGDNAGNLALLLARAAGMEALPRGDWQNEFHGETTVLALVSGDKAEVNLAPFSLTLGETTAAGNITAIQEAELNVKAAFEVDTINLDLWLGGEGESEFELPEGVNATIDLKIGEAIYQAGPVDDVRFLATLENQKLSIEKLQAAIPGNTSITLYGTLEARAGKPVFAGNVDLESRTFRALLDWLEVDYSEFPRNRLSRFSFSGKIYLSDPVFEVERAAVTLDSTRFSGGLSVNLDQLSHFVITGSVNTLDLDSYFPDLIESEAAATLAGRVQNLRETLKGLAGYTGMIDLKAGRLKLMGANLRGVAFTGSISGGTLLIRNLEAEGFEGAVLSFSGRVEDIPGAFDFDIELAVSSNNLSAVMDWAEVESPFEERVVPSGNLNVSISGNLAEAAMDISGTFSGIGFELEGEVLNLDSAPVFNALVRLDHDNTVEFIRKFSPDYFPARSALGRFSLNARLAGEWEDYTLDGLNLQLGPAVLQGTIRFQDRNGRPFFSGQLAARNLVLDDFMAPAGAGLEAVTKKRGERWSDDQWDLTFLRENDLDVTLRADSLNFRTYRFLNPRVRLIAEGGILRIENLAAGFFGGTIMVNATMDARATPELDINLELEGVSTEAALKASADITQLTGTMTLTGAFRGTGTSQRQMISTLSGSATVTSKDGQIKGINMPRLAERMETLDNLKAFSRVLGAALEGGQTAYQFISASTTLTGGVITFDRIEGDIEATEMGGRGRIDLPAWTIEVSGAIRLKDQPEVPAIGYRLRGPVDEPEVKYNYAALTAFMTRRFTSTLFQQLLAPPPEAEGALIPEREGAAEEAEPTPEEQVIRGIFDLLGIGRDEEETPPEEEGEDEG